MLAASGKIIVIAPDLGLRQSLTFALEVEGYQVEAHASWGKNYAPSKSALCIIVDDQVLRFRNDALQFLLHSGHAVILLTDGLSPPLENSPGQTLTKPFDGAALVGMVKRFARTS
ncbi:transcriptional regulator [Rhizobium puerariae]|uniref:Transcriptional regulator n=1 Tax=Rhizobium puerariae TaxID=1585791 RepID=A0ABV6AMA7_9HYPH